jgi:hypothetical protein
VGLGVGPAGTSTADVAKAPACAPPRRATPPGPGAGIGMSGCRRRIRTWVLGRWSTGRCSGVPWETPGGCAGLAPGDWDAGKSGAGSASTKTSGAAAGAAGGGGGAALSLMTFGFGASGLTGSPTDAAAVLSAPSTWTSGAVSISGAGSTAVSAAGSGAWTFTVFTNRGPVAVAGITFLG